jgi:phospholipid/cholesterol/gamma-HCH transport system substrate-binding protein
VRITTETRVGIFVLTTLILSCYLIFYSGMFRIDHGNYAHYTILFQDCSGLEKKADVKIAGVKVGWVEKIELTDEHTAKAHIMIKKKYELCVDSYGTIRQETILGSKYLDLFPGSLCSEKMNEKNNICLPGKQCPSIDQMLNKLNSLAESIDTIIEIFNKDITTAAATINRVGTTMEDTVHQAECCFNTLQAVCTNITDGKGTLGKLMTDDKMYHQTTNVISTVDSCISQFSNTAVMVDSHGEYMFPKVNKKKYNGIEESKWYLNTRIYPINDYFFDLQIVRTERGKVSRKQLLNQTEDHYSITNVTTRTFNAYKFGFQVGTVYQNAAFRFGILESSFGFGIDLLAHLYQDKVQMLTSFEAFGFQKSDRIGDSRPYLRWLSRLFILDHFYIACGANDFISKENAQLFIGAGVRFSNEGLTYF